jgi:hypothetical protein
LREKRSEERRAMDDYAREMMELKTLVTRTLEKKGVLAKIRVSNCPSPHFRSTRARARDRSASPPLPRPSRISTFHGSAAPLHQILHLLFFPPSELKWKKKMLPLL